MAHNVNFLSAQTDVAELMRSLNWDDSPLGSPECWPESLQTVVNLMLRSKAPRFLVWGPDLILLYNDAYLSILGAKHPSALAQPFREVWAEMWLDVSPLIKRTLEGEPLYFENMPFILHRRGYSATAWISFSYTPLYDGNLVAGVYCELTETTNQVIVERNQLSEIRQLQRLFEQAPSMIAVLRGPTHVFESANPAYLQFIGGRDVIGKPVSEALPEMAAQEFPQILDDVYTNGKPYTGEAVTVLLQREPEAPLEERIINFVNQPIRDNQGAISGIFVQGIDITESVRTARALSESDNRIRQLANTIPQLAWMADATGNITWYNERWYEYTGTKPEEMEGWGWQSVHDPAELPKVIEGWKHSLESGEPFEMVFPIKGCDGQYRPFFTLVAPLKDSNGTIVQWFGTNTDVSSLEKAHQELRKTQDWLADGLVAGRMVVWEWNLSTSQVKYSDNADDVLGYSSGDAAAGWANVHPDDIDRLKSAIDLALQERGRYTELTRRIRPDNGELIWVQTQGRVIVENDAPRYVRGIMVDVTERVTAERELTGANQRKDEFLAMLAHELRNPLAPISSAAELLKIASDDHNLIHKASDVISRQVVHMTSLVDDLLDVSRVSRGLVKLHYEDVEVGSVISAAIEQVRPIFKARNHSLNINLGSTQAYVRGDRTRLIQMCANLLNNAAKYTSSGGQIDLALAVQGGDAVVTVEDNGIGIDPAIRPHIFDLFTQGPSTPDRSQGGLGLGLALVKNLTQLHAGTIEASSEGLGMGSIFTLKIPIICPDDRNVTPHHSECLSPTDCKFHFMVVDDNIDGAEILSAVLIANGHRVDVATNGHDALQMAESTSPDVMILDIGLPDMDGLELVKRLKAMPSEKTQIFIALTGYGQPRDKLRSQEAGFHYHFVKPLKIDDLFNVIKTLSETEVTGNTEYS